MRLMAICAAVLGLALAAQAGEPETPGPTPYYDILFETLHPEDRTATEGWEPALRAHLDDLRAAGLDDRGAAAANEILALIDLPREPIEEESELIGDWRVRSLQADGLGAYAYQYFPARIFREARALVLDKNSGSQRHRGLMALAPDGTMLFAGALYYHDQPARLYSAHTDDDLHRDFDAVAVLHKLGEDHYFLAFAPQDNRFRFYEMRRPDGP